MPAAAARVPRYVSASPMLATFRAVGRQMLHFIVTLDTSPPSLRRLRRCAMPRTIGEEGEVTPRVRRHTSYATEAADIERATFRRHACAIYVAAAADADFRRREMSIHIMKDADYTMMPLPRRRAPLVYYNVDAC